MKKRVLILTSKIGGGHESVAQALVEHIKNRQLAEVKKVDLMREANKLIDAFWIQTYKIQTIATPSAYGTVYSLTKNHTGGLDNFFEILLYKALKNIYQKFRPSTIILTHPFQVSPCSKLKHKIAPNLQLIEVVTDFKSHALHVGDEIDKYVVASDFTKRDLQARGVAADKLLICGIPVKPEFTIEVPAKQPGAALRLLVLGGSLGALDIKSTVKQILSDETRLLEMVVVCGRNRYLKKSLEQIYLTDPRVTIQGFTDKICQLMDWADAVVTKPGGLTITEAIYRQTPLIIPYSYPGQERENLQFLLENDLAIYVKQKRKIGAVINDLTTDRRRLTTITNNLARLKKQYSIEKILELI